MMRAAVSELTFGASSCSRRITGIAHRHSAQTIGATTTITRPSRQSQTSVTTAAVTGVTRAEMSCGKTMDARCDSASVSWVTAAETRPVAPESNQPSGRPETRWPILAITLPQTS